MPGSDGLRRKVRGFEIGKREGLAGAGKRIGQRAPRSAALREEPELGNLGMVRLTVGGAREQGVGMRQDVARELRDRDE